MSKKSADVSALVRRFVRAKEAGKRNYKRSDELMKQIISALGGKLEAELEGGKKLVIVDKFKEKDGVTDKLIVWNPCAARRWDLEVIEP